ncbi:hypothetical protein J1605_004615 [Eschrichtius robustus]|uniref:Dual specificity protein phosphatase 22 n=1 Tax=Eschrichtius robustus TaxID=9764 RepID=A0AB34HHN1_ESCRO|nr:hypothetical protein J1605_004615 [Eschrichtius robustus]
MGNGMNKVTWPSSLPCASTPQPACRGFAGEGSPARPQAPERRGPPRACVCEAPGPRRFRLVAENSPCPLAAPALILPGLYIGNFKDARDAEQLSKNKVTHILSVHDSAQPTLEVRESRAARGSALRSWVPGPLTKQPCSVQHQCASASLAA